ncbi:MAG: hypothetical protein Q9168_006305 [Polycauliona sp. 1 TL-2023]
MSSSENQSVSSDNNGGLVTKKDKPDVRIKIWKTEENEILPWVLADGQPGWLAEHQSKLQDLQACLEKQKERLGGEAGDFAPNPNANQCLQVIKTLRGKVADIEHEQYCTRVAITAFRGVLGVEKADGIPMSPETAREKTIRLWWDIDFITRVLREDP